MANLAYIKRHKLPKLVTATLHTRVLCTLKKTLSPNNPVLLPAVGKPQSLPPMNTQIAQCAVYSEGLLDVSAKKAKGSGVDARLHAREGRLTRRSWVMDLGPTI